MPPWRRTAGGGSEAERWSDQSNERLRGEKVRDDHTDRDREEKRKRTGDNDFRMLLGSGTAGRFARSRRDDSCWIGSLVHKLSNQRDDHVNASGTVSVSSRRRTSIFPRVEFEYGQI